MIPTPFAISDTFGWIARTPLAKSTVGTKVLLSVYFWYKRLIEDDLSGLTKRHSYLFTQGHLVDVGACLGYSARVLAKVLAEGATLVAIEPDKENFSSLIKKTQELGQSMVPLQLACGAQSCSGRLLKDPKSFANHTISYSKTHSADQKESSAIEIVTLDSILQSMNLIDRVTFIKIDVQGATLDVLKGMTKTFEVNPKVNLLFEIDVSRARAENPIITEPEIFSLLSTQGYRFYSLERGGHLLPQSHNFSEFSSPKGSRFGYADVLASKEARLLRNL